MTVSRVKICEYKKVFKCCLKTGSDDDDVSSAGRVFHTRGAATPRARSPMITWRVDGTSCADVDAERSRRRESMSATRLSSRARYGGATTDSDNSCLIAAYYSFSTPRRWKAELVWLADPQRTVHLHKWLPISCRSGAGQGTFAGQRPTLFQFHWATPLTWRSHTVQATYCNCQLVINRI